MASIHKLTDREVKTAPGPWLSDGGNLLLKVTGRSRVWFFRYKVNGKQIPMSLGSYPEVTLAEAREKAAKQRKLLADDVDPKAHRETSRKAVAVAAAKAVTFDKARDEFLATRKQWSAKYSTSWKASLETYATPIFGAFAVAEIDRVLVQKVLDSLQDKQETMHRVRERIETVLSYATVRDYRSGPNPAVWRGNLEFAGYEARDTERHHTSLAYAELPAFMSDLRDRDSDGARALEFTILTGVRASEAIEADWREIDWKARVWTIPGNRMKTGREHEVPLSAAAIAVLKSMQGRDARFVFPGTDTGAAMTTAAMLMLLKRTRAELTVHGFRSTFKQWAVKETAFADEVSEMALAHTVGNKVAQAYRRGAEAFNRRRELMEAWADYCNGGNVVRVRAA